MYLLVKCNENVLAGDVLYFNTQEQIWEKTSTMGSPICVAEKDAQAWSEGGFFVKAIFAGQVLARASRDIPQQGGELQVENGGVYVDNSADGCGIICPQFIDNTSSRNAGDLVQVIIR
tara:strand:+ start:1050 stop:1403 length:354 start_codon:yes stop_codon:yes gene_type:complete